MVDTFALSHVGDTSILTGAAANHAASLKTLKYSNIAVTNIFVPVAIETGSAWDIQASKFIQELGKRITVCTKDYQRNTISISTIIVYGHPTG